MKMKPYYQIILKEVIAGVWQLFTEEGKPYSTKFRAETLAEAELWAHRFLSSNDGADKVLIVDNYKK